MNTTITSSVVSVATFSQDGTQRFMLKKEWNKENNKENKTAVVIMLRAGSSDGISMDLTTMYVTNNLYKLGYSSVSIVNLFSATDSSVKIDKKIAEEYQSDNEASILQSLADTDLAILAWGKASETKSAVKVKEEEILKLLVPFKEKLHTISDGRRSGFHPLAPQIRSNWILEPFVFDPKYLDVDEKKVKKKEEIKPRSSRKAKPVSE